MIGGSFLFLKDKFPLIYFDCERMEKNLVEGDGIESIMLAGRICERVTKTIFEIEGLDYIENQFKRIQKLNNLHMLPKGVKDNFNQVRILRNDVYHRDVAKSLSKSTYTRTYGSLDSNSSNSSTTRTYGANKSENSKVSTKSNKFTQSTEFAKSNHGKSEVSNSIGELASAKQGHKFVFNILVWFYGEYGDDREFVRPNYKIGKRSKDADILIRLKHAIVDESDFREVLVGTNKNNKIVSLLKELRGKDLGGKSSNPNLVYKDNKNIKIRKADKPYSECMGISYDDEIFMWKANYGDKELGLFNTSKEAYVAREVFLNSIPVPKLNSDGKYSKHIGVSFSKVNKMWTVSAKGVIVGYCTSEKDAILMRDSYYKKHGLIIKYKNNKSSNSFNSDSSLDKNNDNYTSTSQGLNSKKNKNFNKNSNNLNKRYVDKKSNNTNPTTLNKNSNKSKVKVKSGKRVKKSSKKPKKDVKVNRKASKYEGVYYEEGLFMWSAEVDGKELGLFDSEEEAKKSRDEYINSRN